MRLFPGLPPNNWFKPNLLRSTNNMAGRACHVVGSATQVGLTQALGRMDGFMDIEKRTRHLEATPLEETKRQLALGQCGPVGGENDRFVRNWVEEREAALSAQAGERAEAREVSTLELSRQSLDVAKSARNWSAFAVVVSLLAIVVSVFVAIYWGAGAA